MSVMEPAFTWRSELAPDAQGQDARERPLLGIWKFTSVTGSCLRLQRYISKYLIAIKAQSISIVINAQRSTYWPKRTVSFIDENLDQSRRI